MVRAIERHGIRPAIDERVYRFEEAGAAVAAIGEGRHFGKICVAF
jgi:NADPH:quinone reductase-like Zn-dependent oxidoreductase